METGEHNRLAVGTPRTPAEDAAARDALAALCEETDRIAEIMGLPEGASKVRLAARVAEMRRENKDLREMVAKAAREIHCAGPLDHRIRVLKDTHAGEVRLLREQVEAQRADLAEWRGRAKGLEDALRAFVGLVDTHDTDLVEQEDGRTQYVEDLFSEATARARAEQERAQP